MAGFVDPNDPYYVAPAFANAGWIDESEPEEDPEEDPEEEPMEDVPKVEPMGEAPEDEPLEAEQEPYHFHNGDVESDEEEYIPPGEYNPYDTDSEGEGVIDASPPPTPVTPTPAPMPCHRPRMRVGPIHYEQFGLNLEVRQPSHAPHSHTPHPSMMPSLAAENARLRARLMEMEVRLDLAESDTYRAERHTTYLRLQVEGMLHQRKSGKGPEK